MPLHVRNAPGFLLAGVVPRDVPPTPPIPQPLSQINVFLIQLFREKIPPKY